MLSLVLTDSMLKTSACTIESKEFNSLSFHSKDMPSPSQISYRVLAERDVLFLVSSIQILISKPCLKHFNKSDK